MENIHTGHRERMREKALKHGFDVFNDHEILEMLLYYAIPRGDTNPLAHNLINTFGSLKNVFEASVDELKTVDGIGESTALFLAMLLPVIKRYFEDNGLQKEYSDIALIKHLKSTFFGENKECFYALFLSKTKKLLGCKKFAEGDFKVSPCLDKIIEESIVKKAHFVVIAHNHISGNLMPSSEDIDATRLLSNRLSNVGKVLYDSIIISGTKHHSMKENGFINL